MRVCVYYITMSVGAYYISARVYYACVCTILCTILLCLRVCTVLQEEVEAKREHNGNFNAMQLLLQSLHRRENWPEQFIAALVACEHRSMAAEIEAEYRRLKTPRRESPPPRRESPPPSYESPPPSRESPPPSRESPPHDPD